MPLTDLNPPPPHWRPAQTTPVYAQRLLSGNPGAAALSTLVRSRDSLTARLETLTGASVRVYVYIQGEARARPDELTALGLSSGRLVWRREVVLRVRGEALVAARSVMALADCPPWIAGMGSRALGHQLFARRARAPQKGAIRRSPIEIAVVPPGAFHTPALESVAPDTSAAAPLLARRSTFILDQRRQLLVQETFLPALIQYILSAPGHRQPAAAAFS